MAKQEEIKIRCSALGRIMHFDKETQVTEGQLEKIEEYEAIKAAPPRSTLTPNQEAQLMKFENTILEGKSLSDSQEKERQRLIGKQNEKPTLTPKQQEDLDRYIQKRDAPPELSKGAKTAIEEIFLEDKFQFRKGISSKFIQKGHAMEDKAITIVSNLLGLEGMKKNETHYENEYIQGTPDAIWRGGFGRGFQFDIKNVYYPDGLDGFNAGTVNQIYEYQGKGYDWLLGFESGFVVKVLQNLPPEMLETEVKKLWKEAGREWFEEIPEKFFKEVEDYFNFERLPLEDRIKVFRVDVTEKDKQDIKDAVILGRKYYATLDEKWNNRNAENIDFLKGLVHG